MTGKETRRETRGGRGTGTRSEEAEGRGGMTGTVPRGGDETHLSERGAETVGGEEEETGTAIEGQGMTKGTSEGGGTGTRAEGEAISGATGTRMTEKGMYFFHLF